MTRVTMGPVSGPFVSTIDARLRENRFQASATNISIEREMVVVRASVAGFLVIRNFNSSRLIRRAESLARSSETLRIVFLDRVKDWIGRGN